MDYKKLAEDLISGCNGNCANCNYATREFECDLSRLAANFIIELLGKVEQLEKQLDEANLNLPIELSGQGAENFALAIQLSEMKQKLQEVTAERDAAVMDMEALMWHSGDGCEVCERKVAYQRYPYTRLGCKLSGECKPKWSHRMKEDLT